MTHSEATSPPTRESFETVPRTKAGIKSTAADQTRALPREGEGFRELPGGGRWDGAGLCRLPLGCKRHLPFLSFSHRFQQLNRSSGCRSSLTHAHRAPHQDTGGDGEHQEEPWLHPTGGEKMPFS